MTSKHILQPCLIAAIFSKKHELQDNLHGGQLLRWRALGQNAFLPSFRVGEYPGIINSPPKNLDDINETVTRMVVPTWCQVRICYDTEVELLPFDEPLVIKIHHSSKCRKVSHSLNSPIRRHWLAMSLPRCHLYALHDVAVSVIHYCVTNALST